MPPRRPPPAPRHHSCMLLMFGVLLRCRGARRTIAGLVALLRPNLFAAICWYCRDLAVAYVPVTHGFTRARHKDRYHRSEPDHAPNSPQGTTVVWRVFPAVLGRADLARVRRWQR
jgi:hypothetical protein